VLFVCSKCSRDCVRLRRIDNLRSPVFSQSTGPQLFAQIQGGHASPPYLCEDLSGCADQWLFLMALLPSSRICLERSSGGTVWNFLQAQNCRTSPREARSYDPVLCFGFVSFRKTARKSGCFTASAHSNSRAAVAGILMRLLL
jgi:hypothetical protein